MTERRSAPSFGMKVAYVIVALSIGGSVGVGGIAWGTLKTRAAEISKVADKNEAQIEALTKELNKLTTGVAVIDERTRRIETEQSGIRDDIKTLLLRLPAKPPRGFIDGGCNAYDSDGRRVRCQ